MQGTIAITDTAWYERLSSRPELEEVNFWKPSATPRLPRPRPFCHCLFELRAPESAICGCASSSFATHGFPTGWPGRHSASEMDARASGRCVGG